MPAEREAREPVPRAACRRTGSWRWVPDISLAAKFLDDNRRRDRIARYRRGRFSELVAAAALMLKGYRILGRRVRTPYGEIDLIAVRGSRLAFVEVKRRATRADAEAAVSPRQAARIARAAEFWVARHPRWAHCEHGLDVILVTARGLPKHVRDALQPSPLGTRNSR